MKHINTRRGFTLIELLVVVLIIGILAAVAVPQYQFAIDKTRVQTYVQHVQNILKAEKVYYLTHGEYTKHFDELDIDFTSVCPFLGGGSGEKNELWGCEGGFGFNLGISIQLIYCGNLSANCNSATGGDERYMTLGWNYSETNPFYCMDHNTSRGKKLCQYLRSQFANR